MFNLQSGLHRQRFPAKLTQMQAKRLKLQGNGVVGEAEERRWARGLGRHTSAVTGICVDSLNRTVISCSTDGKVKVISCLLPLGEMPKLTDLVLGLHDWKIAP